MCLEIFDLSFLTLTRLQVPEHSIAGVGVLRTCVLTAGYQKTTGPGKVVGSSEVGLMSTFVFR